VAEVFDIEAAHQDITRFFSRFGESGVVPLAAGGITR